MLSRKIAQFNGMTAARQGGENAYSRFKMEIFHENGRFHGENGRFLEIFLPFRALPGRREKCIVFAFGAAVEKSDLTFTFLVI